MQLRLQDLPVPPSTDVSITALGLACVDDAFDLGPIMVPDPD